jgi:hypothetical protein
MYYVEDLLCDLEWYFTGNQMTGSGKKDSSSSFDSYSEEAAVSVVGEKIKASLSSSNVPVIGAACGAVVVVVLGAAGCRL